jgi:hypothetical protein
MNSLILRNVARQRRLFSEAVAPPARRTVSLEERAALRATRKERASRVLQQHQQQGHATATEATGAVSQRSLRYSRWMWYVGVGVPTGLLAWGMNDEDSPPAKLSRAVGLTSMIQGFVDPLAKPTHDKLLPDWSQVSIVKSLLSAH